MSDPALHLAVMTPRKGVRVSSLREGVSASSAIRYSGGNCDPQWSGCCRGHSGAVKSAPSD